MSQPPIKQLIDDELAHLLTVKASNRPWHLPLLAALTISLPVLIGALTGALAMGIQSSLGAMVILNLPTVGSLWQRQRTLLYCALAMSSSFGLGLLAQNIPSLRLPMFALITFSLVMAGRYWRLPPPAGLFIVMAGAIALFMPIPLTQIPAKVAVVATGSIFAWLLALAYNVLLLKLLPQAEATTTTTASSIGNNSAPHKTARDPALIPESLIVTGFVVLALAVALWLDLSHPYWVPMSCFIVMQGMHLRTMWIKQLHRLLGTLAGIFVAWGLLSIALPPIGVAVTIFLMMIWIETMITRHYGLAVMIITPLTIFIAEFGGGHAPGLAGQGSVAAQALMEARLLDTALGCFIALLGGVFMHSKLVKRAVAATAAKVN